jgi:hypothetical protein
MSLAANGSYPILNVFWTMLLFFGLIVFFWLLITIFGDLFRRDDIGGWAKTLWTIFVIVVPVIGCLVYLISQGHGMAERGAREAKAQQTQMDDYIRSVAASNGSQGSNGVDEIARAKQLLDNGAISEDEFEALKKRALV